MTNMFQQARSVYLLILAFASSLVAYSLYLVDYSNLAPCPLCIFQRTMFLLIALWALGASIWPRFTRLHATFLGTLAVAGMAVALHQSILQYRFNHINDAASTCLSAQPNLIENLIEWLGNLWPYFFMATGFCEEVKWQFLGLSLANWAILAFILVLLLAWYGHRTQHHHGYPPL